MKDWANKRPYRPGWARRAKAALARATRPEREFDFVTVRVPGVGVFIKPKPRSKA
jgi:hypothetical protein